MVVHLTSWASGYVQQCSAPVITITDTTALDATLVSAESVSSAESSVPPSLPGYHTIRGTVYQTADGIRQPLAGAGVYYEPVWDIQVANTVTDGSGRFLLCGILSSASANLSAYAEHKGGWAMVPPGQTEVEIDVR